MDKNRKITDITVEELKDIIEKSVRNVMNEFMESLRNKDNQTEYIDFENEDIYGDNGGD